MRGWFQEPQRHSLAARGIRSRGQSYTSIHRYNLNLDDERDREIVNSLNIYLKDAKDLTESEIRGLKIMRDVFEVIDHESSIDQYAIHNRQKIESLVKTLMKMIRKKDVSYKLIPDVDDIDRGHHALESLEIGDRYLKKYRYTESISDLIIAMDSLRESLHMDIVLRQKFLGGPEWRWNNITKANYILNESLDLGSDYESGGTIFLGIILSEVEKNEK